VAARVGMPMTWPWRSTRAPPELPGLMGALVWITLGRATPLSSLTVRPRALMIPSVTLDCSPRGLPMARATSPTSSLAESAKPVGGEAAAQPGRVLLPVGQGDLEAAGPLDHVGVGDHVAVGVEDDARAEPLAGLDQDHRGADLLEDLDELLLLGQRGRPPLAARRRRG